MIENFKYHGNCNSFQEVVPSKKIFEDFKSLGYNHKEAQCHYNAKCVNILDSRFDFVTGMLITNGSYYPIVTHSFNLFKGEIIDFSRISQDSFSVIGEDISSLPHEYFGITIPCEFVKKFKSDMFDSGKLSMRPLIFEWYKELKF